MCLQKAPKPPDTQSGSQHFGEGRGQYTLRIHLIDLAFVVCLFYLQLVIWSQSMVGEKSCDRQFFLFSRMWTSAPVISVLFLSSHLSFLLFIFIFLIETSWIWTTQQLVPILPNKRSCTVTLSVCLCVDVMCVFSFCYNETRCCLSSAKCNRSISNAGTSAVESVFFQIQRSLLNLQIKKLFGCSRVKQSHGRCPFFCFGTTSRRDEELQHVNLTLFYLLFIRKVIHL